MIILMMFITHITQLYDPFMISNYILGKLHLPEDLQRETYQPSTDIENAQENLEKRTFVCNM